MNLLEKIKININYLLGNAPAELYAPKYHGSNTNRQERWQKFSENDGFTWFGVDAESNIAQFQAETAYVPETFFQDAAIDKKLVDFFNALPDITTGKVSDNLLQEIKPIFARDANKGFFIFEESNNTYWYQEKNNLERSKYRKIPYELYFLPNDFLKVVDLPDEIQDLLKPYHFKDLKFADCQFLDVSKYFYCEE